MTANFSIPINISQLQNDRLRLVPLEESLDEWAAIFVNDGLHHPEVYQWLTYGPFRTATEYCAWYDNHIRSDSSVLLLAILLKASTVARKDPITGEISSFGVSEDTFAGISGLIAQPENATVDLGQMLLARFRRTFVGTHALGVMLRHCLNKVEDEALGLRRVQWQANASNTASVEAAKRMGFRWEGVIRWQQVLPVGKMGGQGAGVDMEGLPRVRLNGGDLGAGRHTAMLSMCWDDWEKDGREHVDGLMRG